MQKEELKGLVFSKIYNNNDKKIINEKEINKIIIDLYSNEEDMDNIYNILEENNIEIKEDTLKNEDFITTTSTVNEYLNITKKYRLLTREEEYYYSKLAQQRDRHAFEMMNYCNLRLVISIAKDILIRVV